MDFWEGKRTAAAKSAFCVEMGDDGVNFCVDFGVFQPRAETGLVFLFQIDVRIIAAFDVYEGGRALKLFSAGAHFLERPSVRDPPEATSWPEVPRLISQQEVTS